MGEPDRIGDLTLEDYISDSSWGGDIQSFIVDIRNKCDEASENHEKAGNDARRRYIRFALPGSILPLITAPIVSLFKDSYWSVYLATISLILTGVFNGVNSFFNYGSKSEQHHSYSAKYSDISTDIREVLHQIS